MARALLATDLDGAALELLGQEYPSFDRLVQFCNQYTLTKNLNFSEV